MTPPLKRIAGMAALMCVVALSLVCLSGCGGGQKSDFEDKGIKIEMETGKTYSYTTACYSDSTKTTTAVAEITKSKRVDSEGSLEAKDGYEWQIVSMELTFHDDNAWKYGFTYAWCVENYYDISALENDTFDSTTSTSSFKVTKDGTEYDCTVTENVILGGWTTDEQGNHNRIVRVTWAAQVPTDYDGMVYGMMDGSLLENSAYKEGKAFTEYYDEDKFLFYRVK